MNVDMKARYALRGWRLPVRVLFFDNKSVYMEDESGVRLADPREYFDRNAIELPSEPPEPSKPRRVWARYHYSTSANPKPAAASGSRTTAACIEFVEAAPVYAAIHEVLRTRAADDGLTRRLRALLPDGDQAVVSSIVRGIEKFRRTNDGRPGSNPPPPPKGAKPAPPPNPPAAKR